MYYINRLESEKFRYKLHKHIPVNYSIFIILIIVTESINKWSKKNFYKILII